MPYAKGHTLSQKPIEGGIEITETEYQAGRENKLAGKLVAVKDGTLQTFDSKSRSIYNTATQAKKTISSEKDTPEGYTDLPPPGKSYVFENGTWVKDEQGELENWRNTISVSSRQGLQQLIIDDLDEQVRQAIESITDTTEKKLAKAWFEKASVWERNNAQLNQIGDALGLTEEDKDNLFISAAKL